MDRPKIVDPGAFQGELSFRSGGTDALRRSWGCLHDQKLTMLAAPPNPPEKTTEMMMHPSSR